MRKHISKIYNIYPNKSAVAIFAFNTVHTVV